MHQVKGKIKETVGKIVGNDDLEAEGKVENLHGKVQEKLSKVEKIVGNRLRMQVIHTDVEKGNIDFKKIQ